MYKGIICCRFLLGLLIALPVFPGCTPQNTSSPLSRDAGVPEAPNGEVDDVDAGSSTLSPDASVPADGLHPIIDGGAGVAVFLDGGRDAGIRDAAIRDAALRADAASPQNAMDGGIRRNPRDECAADSDCTTGSCLPLPDAEDAVRYCVTHPLVPRIPCESTQGLDPMNECCSDDDCVAIESGGRCASFSYGYCGGPPPPEANICRYHQCNADVDCGPGHACMPEGAFGEAVRTCVQVNCRTDEECAVRSGGQCRPMTVGPCAALFGFFCTYSDDPCREDADCPSTFGSGDCVPTDEGTRCEQSVPPP